MPRHYSTTSMIEKLSALLGTDDLSPWETDFVTSVKRRMDAGEVTKLSERQVTLDRLHSKHFA